VSLVISEVFGPTFQGEGPSAGRRAGFVRLGMCNLNCSWCDTPYSWDWDHFDRHAELRRIELDDVLQMLSFMTVPLVVITGGEPLVQRKHLPELVHALAEHHDVEIETNGTLDPGRGFERARFNVSPKLANSGVSRERAWKLDVLARFARRPSTAFKFVCQRQVDLDEVAELVEAVGISPASVWVMPEGRMRGTLDDRMRLLAPEVLARGWNITDRLHVKVWGDARGH